MDVTVLNMVTEEVIFNRNVFGTGSKSGTINQSKGWMVVFKEFGMGATRNGREMMERPSKNINK